MDKTQILKEKIKDAELVLIGIGQSLCLASRFA